MEMVHGSFTEGFRRLQMEPGAGKETQEAKWNQDEAPERMCPRCCCGHYHREYQLQFHQPHLTTLFQRHEQSHSSMKTQYLGQMHLGA